MKKQKLIGFILLYVCLYFFIGPLVPCLEHSLFAEQVITAQSVEHEPGKPGIDNDGRFIIFGDGIIKDTKTGLIWASEDNGTDLDWKGAKEYCENYRGGGYTDWRMPTADELASLYDESQVNLNPFNVSRLIKMTACCPWSSETNDFDASSFHFLIGRKGWANQSYSEYFRALPVRGKQYVQTGSKIQ